MFAPPSCANYFKIMQIFTRNWVYTPDFGLKMSTPFVKPLNSHPTPAPNFKSLSTGL